MSSAAPALEWYWTLPPTERAEVLRHMAPAEREDFDRLIAVRPPWRPLPGPQTAAYDSPADILLYGGAAGGGKTDLLLGVAKSQHFRSVIFRRVFPSLGAIIDRSQEIYGGPSRPGARHPYNESKFRWKFSDGRSVRFGSIQFEKDVRDWQGQAHDLYGFDEITEFSEAQFRYVIGWNRTTRPGQRCRVICTCNPPTSSEGDWIIRFWAPWLDDQHPNPAKPGELRWFTTIGGKDVEVPGPEPVKIGSMWVRPKSRTFIPAKVQDNPFLLDSGYVATLQALPEPLRSKMLFGDFAAGREDDAYQVIPSAWLRAAQARWSKGRPKDAYGRPVPLSSLGVDVARGGPDQTVLSPRYDYWFGEQIAEPGKGTPDGSAVARLVVRNLSSDARVTALCASIGKRPLTPEELELIRSLTGNARVKVDLLGVGTSPYDKLCELLGKDRVDAMNGAAGSKARDKSKKLGFVNKRAEWYWKLREALDPESGQELAIPPDSQLYADLCAPTWWPTARGIQVEAKDEIIKRLGRSPDRGDSLVYAHAAPAMTDLDFLRKMTAQ